MSSRVEVPPDLERLFDALPTGVAVVEVPGSVRWANEAYFDITGRTRDLIGTDFHRIDESGGSWAEEVRRAVDGALHHGAPSSFRSIRALHRRESAGVYLDVDVRPLPPGPGGRARAVLIVRDVSERVAEEQRAMLFYAAFRTSTNPMQLTDERGVMIDVNPAFERVYGYSRKECIGRKPNLVRSRHTLPEVYERLWADLKDPARGYWSGEILNRDRLGRERPVLLTVTAIRSNQGEVTHYLGVAVDQSEQRSWEMRAAHSDRLASVGQLAAGVAHEINTPLANVMLVTESLRRKSTDPWVLSRLGTITDQVEAAARIVRGLLDFSRRESARMTELDLVEAVRGGVEFVRGKQSADLQVEESYPSGPVRVLGDRGQLVQVLTNLLNNASDAMRGRGRVLVSVRRLGRRAEVDVVDGGPGIPAEVLPHIFDPFFTTKPEGEGTGLGLAICHGILQSHHGSITARNVPGAGAGFLISLPLASEGPLPPSPGPAEKG